MSDRYDDWPGQGWPPPPGRPPPPGSGPPPDPGDSPFEPRRPRSGPLRRLGRWAVLLFVFQIVLIASLNLWRPTYSAFMLATEPDVIQEYVAIDHVSRNVLAAVMFHEDQEFPTRFHAFDLDEYVARVEGHRNGEEDPSGSTIHQQVAKNLFLWRDRSILRKGLETVFAVELAPLVEDVKVLEVYVNVAEFGPDIYGICAASWYYYDRPPHDVEEWQAIELAGLLPSPGHASRVRGEPGGGIDTSVDGDPTSAYTVANAKKKLPPYFDRHGLSFVRALGIAGTAEPAADAPDSCSAMPQAVADRIAREEAE
jgi:monofunctional biosynthetic peptidoglycan transglycosylase